MGRTIAPHAPLRTPPLDCARCGRGPLLLRAEWLAAGRVGILLEARGLCRPCYRVATLDGTLTDYPTFYWPPLDHDAVVERYGELKDTDLSMRQIAEEIGVSYNTLYVILRAAGHRMPGATRQAEKIPAPLPEEEAARLRRLVGIGYEF